MNNKGAPLIMATGSEAVIGHSVFLGVHARSSYVFVVCSVVPGREVLAGFGLGGRTTQGIQSGVLGGRNSTLPHSPLPVCLASLHTKVEKMMKRSKNDKRAKRLIVLHYEMTLHPEIHSLPDKRHTSRHFSQLSGFLHIHHT